MRQRCRVREGDGAQPQFHGLALRRGSCLCRATRRGPSRPSSGICGLIRSMRPWHRLLGLAHYVLKQYSQALPLLRECVSRAPDLRAGHSGWLLTYAQLGNIEKASAEAAEALRIEPKWTIEGTGRQIAPLQAPRGCRALSRRPAQGGPAGKIIDVAQPSRQRSKVISMARVVARGRDEDCSPPPAQIPACGFPAPGSCLGSNVIGLRGIGYPCSSDPWARCFSDMPVPALCPGHALQLTLPLTGRRPSTVSAADVTRHCSRLHRYNAAVRLLIGVHAHRSAVASMGRSGVRAGHQ